MRWSWGGAVALVLAVAVGVGWAIALVVAVLDTDPLEHSAAALLYGLGGTIVGGVIGWLGRRGREGGDDDA